MTEYLFTVQSKNRLEQKGLLKRFSTTCYGTQETKESIRAEKALKYEELKFKKNSPEYEAYFLSYSPSQMNEIKHSSPSAYVSPMSLSSGTIATTRLMKKSNTTAKSYSSPYKSKTKRHNTSKPTSTRKKRKISHSFIKF
jgi:hypothetical protein